MLLLLAMLSLAPALILVLEQNFDRRRSERVRVSEAVNRVAELVSANENGYVKNARQLLATLSEIQFLARGTNAQFCSMNFANLLKLSPDYVNFGLIERSGQVFASGVPLKNTNENLGDRSYFQQVVATRRFSIGEFQRGRITGKYNLNFGFPILNESNEVERVLFAAIKLDVLTEAAETVDLPYGATVTVMDRTGTILACVPRESASVGRRAPETLLVGKGASTSGLIEVELEGEKHVVALHSIKDTARPALHVAVAIPAAVLFSGADRALVRGLVTVACMTALILLSGFLFADRTLVRPVNNLMEASNRLGDGDLAARAPEDVPTQELHELAAAFNRMASSLQRRECELVAANDRNQQLNAELEAKVRERTAQLSSAVEELESFSYSVSHDLRAPLRHLDGFAQLLGRQQAERLDEKGRRHLEVISASARKMGTLIDELLAFSRMGRQEMLKSAVAVRDMVDAAIAELASEVQGRQIEWVIGELPVVKADPAMLRQVWINLLSNAVKYTRPSEAARIEVEGKALETEVQFVVRDNGVGFDPQYGDKLFGVFQRLHRESEFEGTGVGLANVRRVVSRHGGRTWAESRLGEGASFYFTIPIE